MRARACAMVSPKSAKSAGLLFGKGWPWCAPRPRRGEQVRAAVRLAAAAVVAAVAAQLLAPAQLQPVVVALPDAAAVGVEHGDRERHAGRHLDAHGPVGLDRRVAQDLAHAEGTRDTEGAAVEVAHVVVRQGHGFSMRRKRAGRCAAVVSRGSASARDAARRLVHAVEVVDRLRMSRMPTPSVSSVAA